MCVFLIYHPTYKHTCTYEAACSLGCIRSVMNQDDLSAQHVSQVKQDRILPLSTWRWLVLSHNVKCSLASVFISLYLMEWSVRGFSLPNKRGRERKRSGWILKMWCVNIACQKRETDPPNSLRSAHLFLKLNNVSNYCQNNPTCFSPWGQSMHVVSLEWGAQISESI